jgi:hypothetical protein
LYFAGYTLSSKPVAFDEIPITLEAQTAMKQRRKPPGRKRARQAILGVAWYRPEQWDRLLEISSDRGDLEDTYSEWVEAASMAFENARKAGINVIKVEVDAEELVEWCRSRNLPLNGNSRSRFAAEKTREQHNRSLQ